MRKLIQVMVAGALALSLAAPALADPPRHHQGRGYDRGHDRDYRDHRRGDHRRYDSHRRNDRRYHDRRDHRRDERWRDQRRYSHYRYAPPVHRRPPVVYYAPPRHHWRPGAYLPRHHGYRVVHDYHRYRLAPPRRGHYYADVDGDILLVAAATGLIVWALNN